jgi:hypothetical protein
MLRGHYPHCFRKWPIVRKTLLLVDFSVVRNVQLGLGASAEWCSRLAQIQIHRNLENVRHFALGHESTHLGKNLHDVELVRGDHANMIALATVTSSRGRSGSATINTRPVIGNDARHDIFVVTTPYAPTLGVPRSTWKTGYFESAKTFNTDTHSRPNAKEIP